VYIAEIDFAAACDIWSKNPFVYGKFSRFPSASRDLAVVIPFDTAIEPLLQAVKGVSPLITAAELFDIYSGKGIDEGCKSAAFRITFSDLTKTLSEDDIHPIMENILKTLEDKFSAKLR
ncbi:MAG: hypothetical protein IJD28_04735, partial [Deferribacterales bacterium]|nr:hypothetical protein [Deferribacterales bacterium]